MNVGDHPWGATYKRLFLSLQQVIVTNFPEAVVAMGHGATVLGAGAPVVAEDKEQV